MEPKIIDIYWMDENQTPRTISELEAEQKVTLCITVEEGGVGTTVNLKIKAQRGYVFEDGSDEAKYNSLKVEDDNTAYVDNFMLKPKNQ